MHLLPHFGAGIRSHHRKVCDERVEVARELDGFFHCLFGVAGQTDNEKADSFHSDLARVFERLTNLVVRHAFVNTFENIFVARFDAERDAFAARLFHLAQQFRIGEIRADAIDHHPLRFGVQSFLNQQFAQPI